MRCPPFLCLCSTALAMAMRYYNCLPLRLILGYSRCLRIQDGLGPVTTVERNYELSHFAVHFSPAYYLMLPFYMLFPHPATLQILQGIFVTSGIIPVFLIARKYGFSLIHSSLFSAIYAYIRHSQAAAATIFTKTVCFRRSCCG